MVPPEFPDYDRDKKTWKPEWLDEEQQDLTLNYVDDVHKPIVTTIFYHGLRLAEARALKRRDFDVKKGTLAVRTLKGGPDREILLRPCVIDLIRSMPHTISSDHLFTYHGKPYGKTRLWKIIRMALDKAGFSHIWPNEAGRHSGLSNMLRRYPDVRLAQYVAGLADIRTTQRYLHHELKDQEKVRRGK